MSELRFKKINLDDPSTYPSSPLCVIMAATKECEAPQIVGTPSPGDAEVGVWDESQKDWDIGKRGWMIDMDCSVDYWYLELPVKILEPLY